jgi:Transglycosylase SLT domain
MQRSAGWSLVMAILAGTLLVASPRPAAADAAPPQNPHFPKPVALTPNVAFWKQVYTEHGVGDFILHDRDELGVIYDVVRVTEKANQVRAEQLAKPEIDRARGKYREILLRLADGVGPQDLGADERRVAELWRCPCPPDSLRRAAENIRVQQGLRQKVDEGLRRARGLLPKIVTILQRHELPVELAALPLVESTYNPAAYSKAGAAGLWQFIRSTGKQYSLVSGRRDHRRDPIRATEAAAHLLKNNYNTLGSWPLAIVAYNHGHAGIQAASAAVGSKAIEDIVAHYTGPRFGFASKNFYAEFLAALDVVHPLLGGHGKPIVAKGRRQGAQQALISNQPPASVGALPAPALVPAPIDAAPVIETPAAPVSVPQAEESSASDQTLTDPEATPVPTGPPADAVEAPAAPETASLPERTVASEPSSAGSERSALPTPPSPELSPTATASSADASPHDETPPEVLAAESPEVASP